MNMFRFVKEDKEDCPNVGDFMVEAGRGFASPNTEATATPALQLDNRSNKDSYGRNEDTCIPSYSENVATEELEEFRTRWSRENTTINKVVKLKFLGHPPDLFDLYPSHRFTNEEIHWLDESGILYWLVDGLISSAENGQLIIDGSNESLCEIIRLCPTTVKMVMT
jgi:hypothetical protein